MVQKRISIYVIVAVVVAAILTLTIVATASSTNQAFAQAKKPTGLSIGTYPCCERKTSLATASAIFFGKLSTKDESSGNYTEGPGGATIHVITDPHTVFWFGTTNEYGSYQATVSGLSPGTYHIHAHYGGDSDHESSDSRTITYTVTQVTH